MELSASAALFKLTVILPGVVAEPPTVAQGTDDDAVRLRTCDTTLEETRIVAGDGTALVPEVREKAAVAEDKTRSGA